ncbi:class I SAM-dependent methyltransferase [Nocardioides daejeonensis]|uniref:class I SAM-dependent methyltransferase n=1 Tax=Nocardioides daejeonensis TaxID=1046556 RepID=UPI000D743E14|nr:class I SAM-dependent methyltransferase [Nocardioides daejeonensis]
MTDFGADFWADQHAAGPLGSAVNPHLRELVAGRRTGSALDVGCGHGGSVRWLTEQGWRVTGVDVVPAAIEAARASTAGLDTPPSWQVGDVLSGWRPIGPAAGWDLVCSFHVHPDGPMTDFVLRLAGLVAPGGALLVVGHHADDPARLHAPADPSVVGEELAAPLRAQGWSVEVSRHDGPAVHHHGVHHHGAHHHGAHGQEAPRPQVDVVLLAVRKG